MKNRIRKILSFVSKNRVATRVLSMTLSLILLFYVIPTVVYGEVIDAFSKSSDGDAERSALSDSSELGVGSGRHNVNSPLYEVSELREENVKHFRLRDGSYIAAQYTSAVHFRDGSGAWQDIDNTLLSDGAEGLLTSDARVKFSKKINGSGNALTLKNGDYEIDLSIIGANKGAVGEAVSFSDAEEMTELQKMLNLEKLSSAVIYREIFGGADMEYSVHSYGINERIIINEKSESYTYSFELKLKGLEAELLENGELVFTDSKTDEEIYTLPPLLVTDALGVYAPLSASGYTLTSDGKKYTLTATVNADWVNSDERAFPVSISAGYTKPDSPAFEIAEVSSENLNVTYVKINELPEIPDGAYTSEVILTLSEEAPSAVFGLYEVTSDWNADTISYDAYLNGAGALAKTITDSATSYSFNITELAEKWRSSPEENYGVAIKALGNETEAALISYAMRSSAPALSVAYSNNEGLEDYLSYTSHSVGAAGNVSINNATGRLTLSIPTISNMNEILPMTVNLIYNSYLSGKSYTYANAGAPFSTKYTPYGFKLNVTETVIEKSYTENGVYKKYYVYEDGDGTTHSFFESSEAGVYEDADGLQKKLTFYTDQSELYINDDSKIEKRFVKINGFNATSDISRAWAFITATDEFGNIITVQSDNYTREPEVLTFSRFGSNSILVSGARIQILYTSADDSVCGIFNTHTKDFAIFRFSETYNGAISSTGASNYLRQVEIGYGESSVSATNLYNYFNNTSSNSGLTVTQKANYEYNSSGRLIKATDAILGRSMAYTWDNQGRVTTVTEYAGSAMGQQLSLSYGTGYTDVRMTGNDEVLNTADDISTRYTFDENGRCVSLYSYSGNHKEIYGATTGKYETQENVKNNLKEQATVGGSSVNYLINGDFEILSGATGAAYWNLSSGAYSYRATSHNTHGHYALRLNPEVGNTAYAEQYVFLKAGTYTLSMLTQTQEAQGHTAYAEISSISGSGLNHSENMSLNPNGANGIRGAFSTTFTVPSHINGGDNVKVKIAIFSESTAPRRAIFYVDDVSLAKGISTADYSYVKYGSFEESGRTASGSVSAAMLTQWKTETESSPVITESNDPFGKAVKVTANNGSSYVKHRLYELDEEYLYTFDYDPSMYIDNVGCEFLVSGFAKASAASLSGDAKFELKVDVVYYQGVNKQDVIVTHSYEFIPTVDDWQFISGSFDTEHERESGDLNSYLCIKAIDLYCDYSNQSSGYALFDNISVVNATDNSVEKYYYYEDSGLLAKKEAATYKEYYFYYENTRNLGRTANNRGEMTDYYYNDPSKPNTVTETIDYDFKYLGSYDYPYRPDDDMQYLNATPKTKTTYTHNELGLITNTTTVELTIDENKTVVVKSGSKAISESTTYIIHDSSQYSFSYANLGRVETTTDSLDITTRYFYDSKRGYLLASVNESTREGLAYTYDAKGNISTIIPAEYVWSTSSYNGINNAERVSYTYNSNNLLSTISTESTTYTFSYDAFGNSSSVNAGNNTLASYEYYPKNGKLKKITYGNGFAVDYVYNRLEMISEIWYTENGTRSLKYAYEYTDDGQIYKFTDYSNEKSIIYRYDNVGKLVSFAEYDLDDMYHDFSLEIFYDPNRRDDISGMYYKLNYASSTPKTTSNISYNYSRNPDGIITETRMQTMASDGREEFTYDAYDRVSSKKIHLYNSNNSSHYFDNDISYTYTDNYEETTTSSLVYSYTSKVNNQTSQIDLYNYDENGNIIAITSEMIYEFVEYTYDDIGQLIREDNRFLNVTYLYEYDDAGNLTAVKRCNYTRDLDATVIETKTYTYSTGAWGDLLTAYNGAQITYDNVGNPLIYNNGKAYNFTWSGRQLVGAVKGSNTYSFTYNDNGYRTSKTVNGVTTTYYLNGSMIMAEETNGNMTVYLYDTASTPIGMQYHKATDDESTWEIYWFEKNLQGDVVAVYNESGTKLISYQYDAWGNAITSYHNGGASTKAADNPFTYRSYYYDRDLEMYYLGSRYYDSVVKRFINADKMMSTTDGTLDGKNLYVYCFNNPVMFTDESGNWPSWAKKLVTAAAIVVAVAAVAVITVATAGAGTAAAAVAVGAAKGAAIGFATGAASGAAIGYAATGTLEGTLNGMADGALTGAVTGAIYGGVKGYANHNSTKTLKNPGKPFQPNGPHIQEGVDPNTLTPAKDLSTLSSQRMKDAVKYGGNQAISVTKNGVILNGHHRVAYAIKQGSMVDVIVEFFK